MESTGMKPCTVYMDLGFRGVDKDNPDLDIKHRGKRISLTKPEYKLLKLKRRQAIKPIIEHTKVHYRMNRNHLKGGLVTACKRCCTRWAAIRWLLRMIVRKDRRGRLLQSARLPDFGRIFGALILELTRFTRVLAAAPALMS